MAMFHMTTSRISLERWVREASASVPDGSLVLDAGAGDQPYADCFAAHRYESADFGAHDKPNEDRLTYVCDLTDIPVEDGRFDLVVMTQVLEHHPEPSRALAEMCRVLKPGAELWYSAPLFYEEHETPYDFYRYTQYAHRWMCDAAGLEVVTIDWLEGYFGTLSYQLAMAGQQLPVAPELFGGGPRGQAASVLARLGRKLARGLAGTLDGLDQRVRVTDTGMPKNYAVRARRPDGERGTAVASA